MYIKYIIFSLFISTLNSLLIQYPNAENATTILDITGALSISCPKDKIDDTITEPAYNVLLDSHDASTKNLSFFYGKRDKDTESFSIDLIYTQKNADFDVKLISVHYIALKSSKFATGNYTFVTNVTHIRTSGAGTYVCNTKDSHILNPVTKSAEGCQAKIDILSIRFSPDTTLKPNKVQHCHSDYILNVVVPLVVGGSLAGLIVMVLIIYAIIKSKARRSAEGYERISDDQ